MHQPSARRTQRKTDCELLETSRALKQAQSRIEAAEDKLAALEFRAQAAEAEAREAKKALALIEEAIRTRLLRASPEDESSLGESERNSVSSARLSV